MMSVYLISKAVQVLNYTSGLYSIARFTKLWYYCSIVELPSDTMAAILYIKSIFPRKKFGTVVPPIVLKHQIYCVVKDKTLVDRQLVWCCSMVL